MPRVSLIVPTIPSDLAPSDRLWAARQALADLGHTVELVVAYEAGSVPPPGLAEQGARLVGSTYPGRAAAAMAGMERAQGDIFLLYDPGIGYDPSDVVHVLDPVARGEADLAVASRWTSDPGPDRAGWLFRSIGRFSRLATGTSDPFSGLIALTRKTVDEVGHQFRPVGRQFSFELLAKVGGNWVDVPVTTSRLGRRRVALPTWDDIRHLKRLADHRFGNLSHLIQFCVVGGSGMIIDLSFYFTFQAFFNSTSLVDYVVPPTKVTVADALARSLAIALALIWNFSLNRRLTFSYARHGSILRQFFVYAASNALGVALSMSLSLGLPRKVAFFSHHKLMAAVVGIVVATGVSFSMSRWVVFRKHPPSSNRTPMSAPEGGDDSEDGDTDSEDDLNAVASTLEANIPIVVENVG